LKHSLKIALKILQKYHRGLLYVKVAVKKGPYARRFGLSGVKLTYWAIERLADRKYAADGSFFNAINIGLELP